MMWLVGAVCCEPSTAGGTVLSHEYHPTGCSLAALAAVGEAWGGSRTHRAGVNGATITGDVCGVPCFPSPAREVL